MTAGVRRQCCLVDGVLDPALNCHSALIIIVHQSITRQAVRMRALGACDGTAGFKVAKATHSCMPALSQTPQRVALRPVRDPNNTPHHRVVHDRWKYRVHEYACLLGPRCWRTLGVMLAGWAGQRVGRPPISSDAALAQASRCAPLVALNVKAIALPWRCLKYSWIVSQHKYPWIVSQHMGRLLQCTARSARFL